MRNVGFSARVGGRELVVFRNDVYFPVVLLFPVIIRLEKMHSSLGAGVSMSPRRNRLVGKQLPGSPRCAGFSLVELLVVIAVIGLLLSLLLPAVQAAREASRRLGCANNLHQIGIALQSYHDTFKHFPEGGVEMRMLVSPEGDYLYPNGRQLAWSAYILPYMEQKSLFDRIDFKKAFDSPENAPAAAEIVSTYLCPSVSRQSYLVQDRGACDYGGILRRADREQQQSAARHHALRPNCSHP
jgi:prepilin-type N-terminal cleavage/methylation domain-containing protein